MRGLLPNDYRTRHPTAPKTVQWHSGQIYIYIYIYIYTLYSVNLGQQRLALCQATLILLTSDCIAWLQVWYCRSVCGRAMGPTAQDFIGDHYNHCMAKHKNRVHAALVQLPDLYGT